MSTATHAHDVPQSIVVPTQPTVAPRVDEMGGCNRRRASWRGYCPLLLVSAGLPEHRAVGPCDHLEKVSHSHLLHSAIGVFPSASNSGSILWKTAPLIPEHVLRQQHGVVIALITDHRFLCGLPAEPLCDDTAQRTRR